MVMGSRARRSSLDEFGENSRYACRSSAGTGSSTAQETRRAEAVSTKSQELIRPAEAPLRVRDRRPSQVHPRSH